MSDDEARTGAAKPQHSRGDLFRFAEASDRLFFRDVFHRFRLFGDHGGNHWCVDGAGAYGIDADASAGVFKGSALGEANHAVLCGMVDSPAGNADEASDGRIVYDRATLLIAHQE